MEDQYVWGQQNTKAQRIESLVDDDSTEMLCKIFITWNLFLLPNSCSIQKPFRNCSYKRLSPFLSISKNFFNPWALLCFGHLCSGIQIPQFSWMITLDMTENRCLEDIFALPAQWVEPLFYHLGVIEITTGVSAGRKITYYCWGTLPEFLPAWCYLEARESRKNYVFCLFICKAMNRYSLSPFCPLSRCH